MIILLPYVSEVPPLWGSINVLTIITQGLAPWAMKSVALAGLIYVISTNQLLACLDALTLVFMCLNIGRIDEVIYKYFCIVLGLTQPRGVRPKYE